MAVAKKHSIVVLRWGWEILHAVADGYEKLGHNVRLIELNEKSDVNAVIRDFEKNPPDFCLTNNMYCFDSWAESGHLLEDYIKSKKIPFIVWFWENPESTGTIARLSQWQVGPQPTHLKFLTVDADHLKFFKSRGLKAAYMPLGLDDRMMDYRPRPELAERFKANLSYSGTPDSMVPSISPKTESELRAVYEGFALQQLVYGLQEMVEFEPSHREKNLAAIRETFVAPIQVFFSRLYFSGPTYAQAIKELHQALTKQLPDELRPLITVLRGRIDFIYSYYLLALGLNELKEFQPKIYGGDAWTHWLLGILAQIKTPRLTDDELKAVFACSKISFALTKTQFSNFLHERVFTILSCRGFPLTDFRPALDEHFPKNTIASYRNFDEAKEQVKYFLAHDSERESRAAKAREWAFEHHTLQNRAEQILKTAKGEFGII